MPQWRVCADEPSFPLLNKFNITGANVIKAPPYLEMKIKGDSSME